MRPDFSGIHVTFAYRMRMVNSAPEPLPGACFDNKRMICNNARTRSNANEVYEPDHAESAVESDAFYAHLA